MDDNSTAPVTDDPGADTHENLTNWLTLAYSSAVSPRTGLMLLQALGSAEAIRGSPTEALLGYGLKPQAIRSLKTPAPYIRKLVDASLHWLQTPDHHILTIANPLYPRLLAEIAVPPLLLYVDGNPDALARPGVAIVGSRLSAPPARRRAGEIAGELASQGLVVTSGLARGIDAAAHIGCLEHNAETVAVVGNGLDRTYPACHDTLAARIRGCGAVVSEFPLGAPPRAAHFPRRNRIIAGLCLGVVVVEAALRSGTLSTARHAIEQGREVMALPGSVDNPLARGCHALLRSGATLVESGDDIVAEVLPQIDSGTQLPAGSCPDSKAEVCPALGKDASLLLACLDQPEPVDRLVAYTGLAPARVSALLVTMELESRVSRLADGRYIRC